MIGLPVKYRFMMRYINSWKEKTLEGIKAEQPDELTEALDGKVYSALNEVLVGATHVKTQDGIQARATFGKGSEVLKIMPISHRQEAKGLRASLMTWFSTDSRLRFAMV